MVDYPVPEDATGVVVVALNKDNSVKVSVAGLTEAEAGHAVFMAWRRQVTLADYSWFHAIRPGDVPPVPDRDRPGKEP